MSADEKLKGIISQLIQGKSLSMQDARGMIHNLIEVDKSSGNIFFSSASSLLAQKQWTPEELYGVCLGLIDTDIKIFCEKQNEVIDVVATGGEKKLRTLYITPSIALILSCFTKVILQGNKSITGCGCGSFAEADIMEHLGFPIFVEPDEASKFLEQAKFIFLYARKYHRLLGKYDDIRSHLGFRDIFKVAACLADPSGAKRQVLGVFDVNLLDIIAETMLKLNIEHGIVFSSLDGIDEISISAPTDVIEIKNGNIKKFRISPSEFGIFPVPLNSLSGKQSISDECQMILETITGKRYNTPVANFIILNSAFALYVAGKAESPKEGFEIVKKAIQDGKVSEQLILLTKYGLLHDSPTYI